MRMIRACLVGALAVAGCTSSGPGPTTGGGKEPDPQHVTVTVSPTGVVADGVGRVSVSISTNERLSTVLHLTTDRGTFPNAMSSYDKPTGGGMVTVQLTACRAADPGCLGMGTVSVTADGVTGSAMFEMRPPGGFTSSSSSAQGSGGQSSMSGASGVMGSSSGVAGSGDSAMGSGSSGAAGGLSQLTVSPQIAGQGTELTVSFRADGGVMGDPVVTVAGRNATKQAEVAGLFLYRYVVTGTEAQGDDPVVVTATLADGSMATLRGSVTLDFTLPTPPSVVVVKDGRMAFVSGRFSASAALQPGGGAPVACEVCVATDGACDTEWRMAQAGMQGCSAANLTCTDGQTITVNLRGKDTADSAWVYGNTATRVCDDLAPSIAAPVLEGTQVAGSYVGGTFRASGMVNDGAGSGAASCEVCVATDNTCDTEWVAGTVLADGRCVGPNVTCMEDGRLTVAVRGKDAVDHDASARESTYTCDITPPQALAPQAGPFPDLAVVPSPFAVRGTYLDSGAGITGCEICVSTDGTCDTEWAPAFTAGRVCEKLDATCMDGETLTVQVRATDPVLMNVIVSPASVVTCDAIGPAAPTGLRLVHIGSTFLEFDWTATIENGAALNSRFYYARGMGPPFNGVDAAQGPSPISVTDPAMRLTGLQPCTRYDVAVTAQDEILLESSMVILHARTACGGDGTFLDGETAADMDTPEVPVVADVDGDGINDIVATSVFSRSFHVVRGGSRNGRPDGSLQNGGTFAVPGFANNLVAADFSGDGIIDVMTMLDSDTMALSLGNGAAGRGNGTFSLAASYPLNSTDTHDLLVGDIDRDGLLDVVVLTFTMGHTISAMLNQGVSTQTGRVTFNTVSSPNPVTLFYFEGRLAVLEDVTADGILDLVMVDTRTDELVVLRGGGTGGRGDGTFVAFSRLPITLSDRDAFLFVEDFDGDGLKDALVCSADAAFSAQLFKGQGASGANDGTFAVSLTSYDDGLTDPFNFGGVDLSDLNGDGALDLVFVGGREVPEVGEERVTAVTMLGNLRNGRPDGTFTTAHTRVLGFYYAYGMVVADTNGDTSEDLVVVGAQPGTTGPYQTYVSTLGANPGTGTFRTDPPLPLSSPATAVVLVPQRYRPEATGVLTLHPATSTAEYRANIVLDGQPVGQLSAPVSIPTGPSPRALAMGDLDRDGLTDLVTVNSNAQDVSVMLGRAQPGTFGAPVNQASGHSAVALAVGDLDADGMDDVVLADGSSANLMVMRSTGAGMLGAAASFPVPSVATSISVGDINGDRIPDVVAGVTGGVAVLLGQGTAGHGSGALGVATVIAGTGVNQVELVDLNGDRILDLVVRRAGTGAVQVLKGNGASGRGNGTFAATPTTVPLGGLMAASFVVADATGDRVDDIIVIDAAGTGVFAAKGNGAWSHGDGTFSAAIQVSAADADAVAVADLDGDSLLDVVGVGPSGTGTLDIALGN